LKRRSFIATAGVIGGTTFGSCSPDTDESKTKSSKTFVLVPGTWHGGWVWSDVKRIMEDHGHTVFTPTPTGVGERAHLLSPDVDLYTHIDDITNVIKYNELENVILIGYSFSGVTITGVADRLKDKIKHIVFYDALVPRKGVMRAWPPEDSPIYEKYEARKAYFIDGYKMDFFKDYTLDMLVSKDYPEVRAKLKRLLTYHPMKQWTTELKLQNGGYEGLPKTYIRCSGQEHRPSSDWMPGPAKNNTKWNWIDLPLSRSGMMTHPDRVAEVFMNLEST